METPNFISNRTLRLPPGFRFHPTDEELVVHYLNRKIHSIPLPFSIPEADVCRSDPWSLPGDLRQERYFFGTVRIKYPNGRRSDRTTQSGYWKPSGKDKQVVDCRNKQVGTKKSLVFYRGKPQKATKTGWIMHEYKIANPIYGVENWVICRVFLKKISRKDGMKDEERVEVENTGSVLYSGPKKFDLNLECEGLSSCGSSGITEEAEEDEESSK